jgi:hypothetical protein
MLNFENVEIPIFINALKFTIVGVFDTNFKCEIVRNLLRYLYVFGSKGRKGKAVLVLN